MYDLIYNIEHSDHILTFNGLTLIDAQYEPDYGHFVTVEFACDYFISAETNESVEVTRKYRGLKGTNGYQADLLLDGEYIKTFMVQTTPCGEMLTEKEPF